MPEPMAAITRAWASARRHPARSARQPAEVGELLGNFARGGKILEQERARAT
jgi:hypothetical protein